MERNLHSPDDLVLSPNTSDSTVESPSADHLNDSMLESLRPIVLRVGRLAEVLFGGAEADVILVLEDRVWRGKGVGEWIDCTEAARHAMALSDVFWIADTSTAPEWRGRPALDQQGVRAYIAAPIVLRNGHAVGVLRVLDTRPRAFDTMLAENLASLASLVVDEHDRLARADFGTLRAIFQHAPGFMAWFSGPELTCEMVNAAYVSLVGREAVIGVAARDAPGMPSGAEFLQNLEEAAQTGRAYAGVCVPIMVEREPGHPEQRFIDFVLQPVLDATGKVSAMFYHGSDVTSQHEAEERLHTARVDLENSLSTHEAIFDHALDVICTVDRLGVFTKVSRHAHAVWGYTNEELVGRAYMDLVHPDDHSSTRERHAQIVAGKPAAGFRNRYTHRDGTAIPMMWSASWSERHQSIFCVAREMTEIIAAEEQRSHTSKMEAVGRLTGGVAHEFNNLLTIIVGSSELLVDMTSRGTEAHKIARLTLEAGERGADLVARLITFSRAQSLEPRPLDAPKLLLSLEPLIRRTVGENIRVELKLPQGGLVCDADRVQLESAILGLVNNARDAMPSGGLLTIRATPVTIAAESAEQIGVVAGRYVQLSVSDTGKGMESHILERASEPFFTTKDFGNGSGLGLSMVHGFVGQSGGATRIRSKPGRGTTVDMFLPRSPSDASVVLDGPTKEVRTAPATILAVEDDPLVRAHVVRLLRSIGYSVVAREDGASALEALRGDARIDLLLTDIVMPGGINGRQLAKQALMLRPSLKVLFTSGYSDHDSTSGEPELTEDELLRKPYSNGALRLLIAKTLGRSDPLLHLEGE